MACLTSNGIVGHINLGFNHDTSQFACDSLYLWWQHYGQSAYPKAKSILLLCDGGGSNNARHYIFKEDLLRTVNKIEIPIRVAHYPPYCSKYNPIEHRLFPHITRALSGVVLKTVEFVKDLIRRTHTRTGLKVTVGILKKLYETKREATDRFLEAFPIHFDDLPTRLELCRPPNPLLKSGSYFSAGTRQFHGDRRPAQGHGRCYRAACALDLCRCGADFAGLSADADRQQRLSGLLAEQRLEHPGRGPLWQLAVEQQCQRQRAEPGGLVVPLPARHPTTYRPPGSPAAIYRRVLP